MGKADLHVHSSYSYDSTSTISAILNWASTTTDLDVIAITDHDRLEGALIARDQAAHVGLEVIPGMEITTAEGHLLALFIERPVPPKLPMLETILRVGEQGGICVAAHPMAFMVHGASESTLHDVMLNSDAQKALVGIECLNSGLWFQASNRQAKLLAEKMELAQTGSSDSHLFWTIGEGYTQFNGYSAQDLRRALETHTTVACRDTDKRRLGYYAGHLFHYGIRRLGWVTWASELDSNLQLKRLTEVQPV